MTLSLDDVRSKRFRMARKSGYEVLEVDEFVDEVEATFEQLFEENANLKKQVESLKSTAPSGATGETAAATRAPAETPTPAAVSSEPSERIVVSTSKDASPAVVRLVQLSTEQAERLVSEATADATRIRDEARTAADQVTGDAQAKAERLEADAVGRSESLDQETGTRRTEMFGELERQRDQLTATVNALRGFESAYRANLTSHLQSQIDVLASGHGEPANPPSALSEPGASTAAAPTTTTTDGSATDTAADEDDSSSGGGSTSDTPRLDALLGDQR